jgi:hypothetical protein
LDSFDFPAYTHTLAVSKYPPTAVSREVAGLIGLSHGCSFRFVFGIPAEALPPSAAIRLAVVQPQDNEQAKFGDQDSTTCLRLT